MAPIAAGSASTIRSGSTRICRCSVANSRATRSENSNSSPSRPPASGKPIENVARPRWPCSASSATIRLESSPPDSRIPTGTSATIRRRTATRSASRTASAQSAGDQPVCGRARTAGPTSGARGACRRARPPAPSRAAACRRRAGSCAARGRSSASSGSGAARPGRRPCRRRRRAQRGQRRGGAQPAARQVGEVQRLDAEPVAGEHEPAGPLLHRQNANMPASRSSSALAPLRPALEQHLGVARGGERVAEPLELGAQLAVVVDAAVEDDGEAERRRRASAARRARTGR